MVRESADLLYNLTVLWAAAGVKPEDVWREMGRREDLLGIAEKLPKSAIKSMDKSAAKMPKSVENKALPAKPLAKAVTPPAVRRRIVALEGRSLRKRH